MDAIHSPTETGGRRSTGGSGGHPFLVLAIAALAATGGAAAGLLSHGAGSASRADHAGATVPGASLARPHPKYPVVFVESGLPPGQQWSVTLDGTTESSTENLISFAVAKELHAYQVGAVPGFTARPSSGKIQVEREKVDVPVTFTPAGPK